MRVLLLRFNFQRFNMTKAFIGKPAPEFSCEAVVKGGDFKTIKLGDFKGKFVCLFFYPLGKFSKE